jgi:DIS3-like exonuclease 2
VPTIDIGATYPSRAAASSNNNNGNANATRPPRPKRKARSKMAGFAPYEKLADLLQRYADKDPTLIRGKIRMLWGKDATAFCTCDRGSLQQDVVIETSQNQNRSLDGDLVFVELLPPDEDDDGDDDGDDDDDGDHDVVEVDVVDLAKDMNELTTDVQQPQTWQDDEVQKALWDPLIPIRRAPPQSSSNDATTMLPQRKGRVVCVIAPKETAGSQPSELNPGDNLKHAPRRTIVGTITTVSKKEGKPFHLMTPNSKCMPQFLCHSSFTPSNGEGGLYRAEYVYGSWAEHHYWPPCVNVKVMGRSCNVEDETLALLVENGVDHGDFPSDVLKDVQVSVDSGLILDGNSPDDLGWRPTPDMYQGRRDYRAQRIFTIDPTTARDLDDALHITQLPDGRVEIGVHIADVSHFVKHETAVDEEAKRRATTVYLVDRVIPMLPRPLCEIACSLNENVERLAFSCVWKMNIDGTVETKGEKKGDEVWYGKTVIKSCARLDYATAQNIIDNVVANGGSVEEMDETLWPKSRRPTGGHTIDQVAADVRLMHKVAMARRKLRFANGALALNGVKLSFKLESDGETPALCAPYPIRDSNRLVEEYMLLANYLVAERLIAHAGRLALLRHHPPPITERMESVAEAARVGKGFVLDLTSSKSLQASLSRLGRECDDELVMQCITELLMTPMRPAEYMAAASFSEEEWSHFALNIPYYTHFTSPIRRYADVIVHRLLQATIDDTVDNFELDEKEIQAVCDVCNEKKTASKAASDRSDRVFLAIYLKKKPLRDTLGVVISVGEKTFTVYIHELGCSGKVFLDEHKQLVDSEPIVSKNGQKRIQLKRKNANAGSLWTEIDIKVFAKVNVSVFCNEKPPIDIKLKLEGPWLE